MQINFYHLTASIVCAAVLLVNIKGGFEPINKAAIPLVNENNAISVIEKEEAVTEKKEESPLQENNSSVLPEKEPTQSEETSSKEVLAEAIKGKIIEKYISPYTASTSYNGVYIKNSTGQNIDIKALLNAKLPYKITSGSEPLVLIMHTHTTESFMSTDSEYYTENFTSRSQDNSKNMVKIGEIVAKKLNAAGIKTLHDKTQHDYPQYNGSYTRSAKTVNSYLKKYPSIKIVLDLHRDAISSGESDKVKLVTEIEGKKAAQVMLVMGSGTGGVTNYPNWKENLKLALKLQQTIEKEYPTLARPLSLVSKNYNQSLTKGSLLIEFGTDANSLSEVTYSAEMVGNSLVKLFNNLKE